MQDIVTLHVNDWKQQLKKGTLELAVLALLQAKRSYGLELLERLKEMEIEVSDGSIYPLLSRLRVEKKVSTEWVDEDMGHAHKYYALTPHGNRILRGMLAAWSDYAAAINRVVGKAGNYE
jgi:PadR family transcriptional regulator PadR